MMSLEKSWVVLALAASLCACSKESSKSVMSASAPATYAPRMAQSAGDVALGNAAPAALPAEKRFLALRSFLVIEGPAESLETMHKGIVERCQLPACELLDASFAKGDAQQKPRGNARMRIQPKSAKALIAQASQGGEVVEERSESEDKTAQVIDTDARIANLIELRERLRKLLKTEQGKLKDLIEVERELARVQTELDSAQGVRKVLASETERVFVSIDLRAKREFSDTGAFGSLRDSIMESGRTLAHSLAALVYFTVAVIPWVFAFGIVFMLTRRWWRRRKVAASTQK
jgi:hypothetical protein